MSAGNKTKRYLKAKLAGGTMRHKIPSKLKSLFNIMLHARLRDTRYLYQWQEVSVLRKVFDRCKVDCVFDIGANRGQYAHLLRQKVKFRGPIVSAEPNPNAFEALKRKASSDRNWYVKNIAVGKEIGQRQFSVMVGEQFSSLSAPISTDTSILAHLNSIQKQVMVKVETPLEFFNDARKSINFKRPFLKMDTQGYDAVIVRAAREIIGNFVGMQSELSFKRLYADSMNFEDALRLYENSGFSLCALVPNNEGHFPYLIEQDGIFINRDFLDHSQKEGIG